jgi:hypothetical protein
MNDNEQPVSDRVRAALEQLAAALADESGDEVSGFAMPGGGLDFGKMNVNRPSAPAQSLHVCLGYCASEGGCGVEFAW